MPHLSSAVLCGRVFLSFEDCVTDFLNNFERLFNYAMLSVFRKGMGFCKNTNHKKKISIMFYSSTIRSKN